MESPKNENTTVEKNVGKQSRHLSKSALLEETGSSWIIRVFLLFFTIILIIFIIWSSITQIEEVAVAEGKIIPSSQVRKIQHPVGGVVSQITIEEGILVEEGQTVIWLDSSENVARLEVKEIQKKALEAIKERHQYFVSQIKKNIKEINLKNIRLSAYHQKILESFKDFKKLESEILSSQIDQLKNEISVLASQEEKLIQQEASLNKEIEVRNILVLKGEVEKVELLNLKRQHRNVVNELSQIPLQCFKLFVGHEKNSLSEISKIDNELAQIDKYIETNKDSLRLSRIRVPVSGIVHNLSVQTAGEVIPPGKTIFEIVPREKNLIAEIRILPKDIGHISIDQKAELRFTAYEVSNYGGLEGTIFRLSPTTFLNEQNLPYYKGQLKLEKGYLGDDPHSNLILPGMTLEANIRTGSKTVLQYLLKPIFKSGRQALRER